MITTMVTDLLAVLEDLHLVLLAGGFQVSVRLPLAWSGDFLYLSEHLFLYFPGAEMVKVVPKCFLLFDLACVCLFVFVCFLMLIC